MLAIAFAVIIFYPPRIGYEPAREKDVWRTSCPWFVSQAEAESHFMNEEVKRFLQVKRFLHRGGFGAAVEWFGAFDGASCEDQHG